ncbi:MAG: hypothetical protein WD402_08220 [Chloroflexota bacterium]
MTGERLDDPLAEATRLVALADSSGLAVRLIGGLAIEARVPGWKGGARSVAGRRDIDLATSRRDAAGVARLLGDVGYVADRHYNAIYGHKQLYFMGPTNARPIDVVIETLEMSHRLQFGPRLAADYPTLSLADLLLSKLQIVHLNAKDALDAWVLLANFPLAEADREGINVRRLVEVTAHDWGWWRTVSGNLDRLLDPVTERLPPALHDPVAQIRAIRSAIDQAPKSALWRLRARIGERVRWYDEPEEIGHEQP